MALASLYCAFGSTLVFRTRGLDALTENPFDLAGLMRLALVGAAGVLAAIVLTQSFELPPRPVRLYALYTVVAATSIPIAVLPGLVVFRVVELSVFCMTAAACWSAFRASALPMRHLYYCISLLIASLVIGVAVDQESALGVTFWSFSDTRLVGLWPAISANGVGMLGLLVFAFGLSRRARYIPLGIVLVAVSQYRTGYIALAFMSLVYLWHTRTRRILLAPLSFAILYIATQTSAYKELWLRGESLELVGTLNNRTVWWDAAIEATNRSPIIGLGLSSGVRAEVLDQSLDLSDVSTIHSTWIEAYAGAGILGLSLLVFVFAVGLRSAHVHASNTRDILPVLILTALAIRSLTGSAIEMASLSTLFFLLAVCMTIPDESCPTPRRCSVSARSPASSRRPDGAARLGVLAK